MSAAFHVHVIADVDPDKDVVNLKFYPLVNDKIIQHFFVERQFPTIARSMEVSEYIRNYTFDSWVDLKKFVDAI